MSFLFYGQMLFRIKHVVNMWSVSVLSAWLGYSHSILCVDLLLKYCNGNLMIIFTDWNMEIHLNKNK